ncbi:sulfatase family protein [Pelagicoccus mobilis]|uniref:Sulfatase n=1 Tax=Pelagicoccus mobilis TaxID=415221 RepID=A0A934RWN4_9BACT|nr:sulfatase [Pelagicoccus mobilis]MBK1877708.1 sulfatase [Pelagicoccus mobilis]
MLKHCLLSAVLLFIVRSGFSEDRPNILWLTSEDNSASWLGCYGNENATTPNIDKFAEENFQYMHAYASAPVCGPSRSTWITGVNAVSMGTHPMRCEYDVPHDIIKYYPDYLKERGYYTANFYKTDYNVGSRNPGACWDECSRKTPPNWQNLKKNQPFFQVLNLKKSHESNAFGDVTNTKHDPAKMKLAAYHPDVPGMRGNYARYQDSLEVMDTNFGEALQALKDAGLDENTIVIYNSDHGGVLPRSKRYLFQNALHCPLIIRIPEKYKHLWPAEKPGSKIDRLVSYVDMPKTWLSITGSTVPDYMQGRIFLGPETEPEQEYHFAFRGRMDERIDNVRAVSDKRYLYLRSYMPYTPWMQRLDYIWNMEAARVWEKAVENGTANEIQASFFAPRGVNEELYDMQNDPDNVNNLANNPEYGAILDKMRQEMRRKQEEIYDAGLIPETECARLAKEHGTTMYEMARNPDLYNVPAILDAIEVALEENPNNREQLLAMLDSDDLGVRYWGIVGSFLLDNKEAGFKALADQSHEIRAMAAWLLVRNGEKEKGLAALNDLIKQNSYAILMVLNIVDWVDEEDAQVLMPAVRKLKVEQKEVVKSPKKTKVIVGYPGRMRLNLLERFGE